MLKHFIQKILLGFFLFNPVIAAADEVDTLIIDYTHNSYGWPALHYSLLMQRTDVARAILELYPEQAVQATPPLKLMYSHFGSNASQDYDSFLGRYESGTSALELAVRSGDIELVRQILDLGANASETRLEWQVEVAEYWEPRGGGRIYERTKFPWTNKWIERSSLYWAMGGDTLDLVDLLLERGAALTPCYSSNDETLTALELAFRLGHEALIKKILYYQAKRKGLAVEEISDDVVELFKAMPQNPLHYALSINDLPSFKKLLEHGCPVPQSILSEAANHPEFLHLLLDFTDFEHVALEDAIRAHNEPLVATLLPRVEPYPEAMQLAITQGSDATVELLLQNGFSHSSSLLIAIENHKKSAFLRLLEQDALNITDNEFFATIIHNEPEMFQAILQHAPPSAEQRTAYKKKAIELGRKEIFALLF